MSAGPGEDDEAVFYEIVNGQKVQRVLRGTIVSEDERFLNISRRDGEWSIAKDTIAKIVRRTRNFVQVKRDSHETEIVRLIEANPTFSDYEVSRKCDASVQQIAAIRRKMREDATR